MPSPWNRVHPRFALSLSAGKPLRLFGIILSLVIFLGFVAIAVFGGLIGLGHYGFGPCVELAARERDLSSFVISAVVCLVFAWFMGRSLTKQFRNIAGDLPGIEGRLEAVVEIDEHYEDGRGHCLSVKISGKEYLLPPRLKSMLKTGRRVKILLWAGTEKVRAVWVGW